MTIHVLAYLPRLPRLLAAEARGVRPGGRARGRRAARAPWKSSAGAAPGWRCWSPRCSPAW